MRSLFASLCIIIFVTTSPHLNFFYSCVHLIILSYRFPFFCPFPSLPPILLSHSFVPLSPWCPRDLPLTPTLVCSHSFCSSLCTLTTFLFYQLLSVHFIYSLFWLHSLSVNPHNLLLIPPLVSSFYLPFLFGFIYLSANPHNPDFTSPILCS